MGESVLEQMEVSRWELRTRGKSGVTKAWWKPKNLIRYGVATYGRVGCLQN